MTLTLRVIRVVILALLAAPLAVGAQQTGKPARLGLLYGSTPAFDPAGDPFDRALEQGLRERGYVLGQHVLIEFRSALGKPERYPALAADLARIGVDVILTTTTTGTKAARGATQTIPIVMAGNANPVAEGLIASLARPGGNVTGVILQTADVTAKRLQLLKEALPGLRRLAALYPGETRPSRVLDQWLQDSEAGARVLGLPLESVDLGLEPGRWETVFHAMSQRGIDAATIIEAPHYDTNRARLAELALKYRLALISPYRRLTEVGCLMSYGADPEDIVRRAAGFVAKILEGARPADLPVEQPTKFHLALNLKTAKALGLTVPASVLARADEVIQ